MIGANIGKILYSALGSFLLGAVFGILYELIYLTLGLLSSSLCKTKATFFEKTKPKVLFCSIFSESNKKIKTVHFVDFLFTLIFGIVYLVLQYILCDGIFRVYFLALSLLGLYAGKRIYKTLLSMSLRQVFSLLFTVIIFVLKILSLPIKLIFILWKRLPFPPKILR